VRPTWPRWLNSDALTAAAIELAAGLGCAALSVGWQALDPDAVAAAREAGLDVAAWTVRDRDVYARLAGLGVVAICAEDAALDG
jgi:glycerophosphoryl diester phosphodiesterase